MRVAAELHVGDVEELLGLSVGWVDCEQRGEFADGALRSAGKLVDGAFLQWEEACALAVQVGAVLLLAETEIGDGEPLAEVFDAFGGHGLVGILPAAADLFELADGGFGVALVEEFAGQLFADDGVVVEREVLGAEKVAVVDDALCRLVGVELPVGGGED